MPCSTAVSSFNEGGRIDVNAKSASPPAASAWDFPLQSRDRRARRVVKAILGTALAGLCPDIVRRLDGGAKPCTRAEHLVLAGLVARCLASGDMERLMPQHTRYWQSASAVSFHAATEARCLDEFQRVRDSALEMLSELIKPGRFDSLCEIGCGSGLVLAEVGTALSQLRQLVGLDLSAEQTAINRSRYTDPRYVFAHGDACQWIPDNARSGWVFMTFGGVLEYFSEASLSSLLCAIARHSPAALLLIEPVVADYDLEREVRSRPYGYELSMTHNYPYLLAQAGFRELRRQEFFDHGRDLRWLAITATI